MKGKKLYIAATILFIGLVGLAWALTPPPPPPPPVPQNLAINDTSIDNLVTTGLDQGACRACHQTSGTNISGGYNNTVGGVPSRHHSLVATAVVNPYTSAPFGCPDCHPSTPGIGNGILLDRSCTDCHNGTSFFADATLGARVGNFSRPHHVNTSYATSHIGNPVANRTCNFCHGSFVNNYNDNHYKPSYDTDFMITPYATFKATNTSQPDGLGGNKTWGGCLSCHLPATVGTISVGSNHDNHHKEILGFARFGGQTAFQNASTPGASCFWCHVIDYTNSTGHGSTFPLRISVTNPFTGETLTNAMEARNSTIENANPVFEPGTTNITINGTGCEKCHGVSSVHNIQFQYVQNGLQGKGHINNNSDCSGCHDGWLPAADLAPGALVPYLVDVSPSVIVAGTATTLTITGSNFVNDPYTSVVAVDGVQYTPTSITDAEITVGIPALTAGVHQLQLVKNGDTLSKLFALNVVPGAHITSATVKSGMITITGTGLGARPATNAQYYVSVNHAGNQIVSSAVTSWSATQIKVRNSAAAVGDVVTVVTADSGQTTATIS